MTAEYRIDFTITRRQDGEDDFTEIGFGASCASDTVNGAVYEVESIIQNRIWETTEGMPDPEKVDRFE